MSEPVHPGARAGAQMILSERDRELAMLWELFAESRQGRGQVAVVTGPVGIGKTALLQFFADQAVSSGARFLGAAASPAETDVPFALIGQLLDRAESAGAVGRRVRRLLDDGALDAMVEQTGASAGRLAAPVLRQLTTALLDMVGPGPVVIGVDDVQHADAASLHCLRHLVRRMRSSSLLLVLSECEGAAPTGVLFDAELLRQPHCRLIRLEPLTQAGVAALLGAELPAGPGQELAAAGYHVGGGSPLLTRALVEDYRTYHRLAATELTLGDAFARAIMICLLHCEPAMRDVARALAVLAAPAAPEVLGAMLDIDAGTAQRAIHGLNAVGLLEGAGFRHAATGAAIVDGMLAADRIHLHARASRVLYDRGADAGRVARHLIAGPPVDEKWAVRVLLEAADEALAADEVRLAVDCLRLAHDSPAAGTQLSRVKAALFMAEWRVNPSAAARHLPALTTAALAGRLRWPAAAAPIAQLAWQGEPAEAVQALTVIERSLAGAGSESAGHDWATELHTARLLIGCWYPELATALEAPGPAPDRCGARSSIGDRRLCAAASLSAVLSSSDGDERAVATAERVLRDVRLGDTTLVLIGVALSSLIYADRLDRAALWAEPMLKEANDRAAPTWRAALAAIHSMIDLRQGDLAAAELHAHDALTKISAKAWGVGIGLPLSSMIMSTTAQGRTDDAAIYLEIPVPDAMFDTLFGLHYLQARGRYRLAVGDPGGALADFTACGELMTRWEIDRPAVVPWRTEAAQALIALGRSDEAARRLGEQRARLAEHDPRTCGVVLRLLAVISPVDQRPPLLARSVQLLQELGDRYETTLAIVDLGEAYRTVGDRDRAATANRRAVRLAKRCGAVPLLERLREAAVDDGPAGPVAVEPPVRSVGLLPAVLPLVSPAERPLDSFALEEAGPPVDEVSLDELSEAELRVAELAAEGHSNREIAQQLFITVSTVEQHLTRIYRKLHVRRTDLPSVIRHIFGWTSDRVGGAAGC
jgi:DNA-binding CsgD family transcriptional regulator